jgi:hypothetical protein
MQVYKYQDPQGLVVDAKEWMWTDVERLIRPKDMFTTTAGVSYIVGEHNLISVMHSTYFA